MSTAMKYQTDTAEVYTFYTYLNTFWHVYTWTTSIWNWTFILDKLTAMSIYIILTYLYRPTFNHQHAIRRPRRVCIHWRLYSIEEAFLATCVTNMWHVSAAQEITAWTCVMGRCWLYAKTSFTCTVDMSNNNYLPRPLLTPCYNFCLGWYVSFYINHSPYRLTGGLLLSSSLVCLTLFVCQFVSLSITLRFSGHISFTLLDIDLTFGIWIFLVVMQIKFYFFHVWLNFIIALCFRVYLCHPFRYYWLELSTCTLNKSSK